MAGRGKGRGGLGKSDCLGKRYRDVDSDSDCEVIEIKSKITKLSKQQAEWALAKTARAEAAKQKEIRDKALIQEQVAEQKKQQDERAAAYIKSKEEAKAKQDMEYAAETAIKEEAKAKIQEIAKKQTKKPLLFIYGDCDGCVYTVVPTLRISKLRDILAWKIVVGVVVQSTFLKI